MKLRIARATADLDEILIYAARSYSRFGAIVSRPGPGRNRAELGGNIRSLVAGSYRIYYRQERKDIVRVLHIKHAARDEALFFGQK